MHMSMHDLVLFGADQLLGVKGEVGALLEGSDYQRIHTEHLDHQGLGWGEGPGDEFENSGSNGRWLAYLRVIPSEDMVIAVATNAAPTSGGEEPLIALTDSIRSIYR